MAMKKARPSTATGIPNTYDCGLVVTLVQFTRPLSEHPASGLSVKCAMVR
jgi:hypothetical protein